MVDLALKLDSSLVGLELEHLQSLFDGVSEVEVVVVKFEACIFHLGQVEYIIDQVVHHLI